MGSRFETSTFRESFQRSKPSVAAVMNWLGREGNRPSDRFDALAGLDQDGAFLARGLDQAPEHEDLGVRVLLDVDAIEAFVQDVERRVGRMDLDALLPGQRGYLDIDAAGPDPDPDRVVALLREVQEVDLGLVVEPDVVAAAEVDLDPAVGRPETVALGDGRIDDAFLVTDVRGPLDEGVPGDVAQAGHGIVRVRGLLLFLGSQLFLGNRRFLGFLLFLAEQREAQAGTEGHGQRQDQDHSEFLVHGRSPRMTHYSAHASILANIVPSPREKSPPDPPF